MGSHIANMDKVPLTFDVPLNGTVDIKGTQSKVNKTTIHEKTHFSSVIASRETHYQSLVALLKEKAEWMTQE